ncbi:MAG: rod shape-determining protein RodA [Deltaproteobacteria bacterium RBG_16_48_10]|nr:MAG: rod shape-determining protein RodA [Deltaproteobacteria bacterium RBG_16_48_10]
MIDRRLIIHFDWTLLGIVLLLASIGILNLYSVTSGGDISGTPLYLKQIFWLLIGLVVMLTIAFIEYRYYSDFGYIIYTIALFLLLTVLGYGIITSGAQRWVKIGSLSFQPSEFVKISFIMALAKFFQRPTDREGYSLQNLYFPFLLLFMPLVLILKQPDLGTAIILFLVFFSILLFIKIHWSSLLALVLGGASVLPILWRFLKEYQKRRVITFFNPDMDPLGAGYHLIQSKIAVGSGGIIGKGFMKGTQCKLGFLPEQHTDFIFSALGEEWGLIGCLFVVGLYLTLILWGLRIAVQSKDRFSAILSFGVVSMLFWHIFINIGMVMGIMPVVGIPLPLLSYGGSFLLSTLIGIGLLLNVSMRRYLF